MPGHFKTNRTTKCWEIVYLSCFFKGNWTLQYRAGAKTYNCFYPGLPLEDLGLTVSGESLKIVKKVKLG